MELFPGVGGDQVVLPVCGGAVGVVVLGRPEEVSVEASGCAEGVSAAAAETQHWFTGR